jgi:hypothetical protein
MRAHFIGLKKHIATLTKILEAMARHKELFEKKGDKSNE